MYTKTILSVIIIPFSTFIFCEYVVYFIVLYQCSWPQLLKNVMQDKISSKDELRVIFIADTHLLGVRKGHWFDKLRREWQMYRTFQTLLALHDPELVFILGDVYDEASFSPDEIYMSYVKRFFQLFNVDENKELFVVAGNHDIGFHYVMHPYLEHRFSKTMDAPSVRLISRKNNHFVLINSMALEKDGCSLCQNAEEQILALSTAFRCANRTLKCLQNARVSKYSRPILLMHFPLYRKNDANCSGWDAAPHFEKSIQFKEKWDCLSKEATNDLLHKLYPRVVFTGHTHHGCHTIHEYGIHEFTVPSFNWRNKPNPTFIMATFNSDVYAVHTCYIPHEYFIVFVYSLAMISCVTILYCSCTRRMHHPKLEKNS